MRIFTFLVIGAYLCAHMLLLPLEFLFITFLTEKGLEKELYWLIAVYTAKCIGMIISFYSVYRHSWFLKNHHKAILYIFAFYSLLLTAFFGVQLFMAEDFFTKHGFGTIYNHPFYYDIIDGCAVEFLATIYNFIIACTPDKVEQ